MNMHPDNEEIFFGKRRWWRALLLGLCLIGITPGSEAHEGPPFPIIVDREVGPYLVSVWTDPDIGIGTFFVVMEPNPESESGQLSKEISAIKVGVEPVSGRLEEKVYDAEAQPARRGARYWVEVEFDKGEMWKVRVIIEGGGWGDELTSEVEATPDGAMGPLSILVYAIPFVGLGILWIRAIIIRRRKE